MYDGPTFIDCNLVHVQGFFDDHQKPWLVRRHPTSISMAVHEGEVPIFAICDSRYSVKLMFTSTALVKELTAALGDSRVTPFGEYEWGAWMLEDKFFIGTEGAPEVWLPLRFRNGPTAHKEGVDFVTIGFRYHADSFECIDVAKCATFAVPASFPVNLK